MCCVCWDTSFILSLAVWLFLSLHLLLCTVWRSAGGESLGPSQIFSNHAPSPGHVHGFLDSQNLWKLFESIIPQNISSPVFPPQALQFVSCLPQTLGVPLPHYFCWLHWSFKSSVWFSLLFILQRGNRGPKRGSDFFRIAQQTSGWAEIRRGMLDSWTSALSTLGLDQMTVAKEPGSGRTPVLARELSKERWLRTRTPHRVGGLTESFAEGTLSEARWKTE